MSAVGKFVCTYILDKIIISDEQIIELNIGPDTEPDIEPSIEADIELNIVLSKRSNIEPNIDEETQKNFRTTPGYPDLVPGKTGRWYQCSAII